MSPVTPVVPTLVFISVYFVDFSCSSGRAFSIFSSLKSLNENHYFLKRLSAQMDWYYFTSHLLPALQVD